MTIPSLIDKQDAFEIVRDKVAQILADESASQMALAVTAGKDPEDWRLLVYTERANPWERWLNDPEAATQAPIINVWFDADSFDMSNGSVVNCQAGVGTINIDCYGFGVSADDGGTGHVPGDELAARESHRAVRLVRNILMAGEYTYLDLRPLVSRRWTQSRTSFQPQIDARTVQRIVATRVALSVKYLEQAPQVVGEALECIHVDLKRNSDGFVLAQLEYLDGCGAVCDCSATHLDDTFWVGGTATWDGTIWGTATVEEGYSLTAIGGWNTNAFRPTEMKICMYAQADENNDPFPISVNVILRNQLFAQIAFDLVILEGEGTGNLVTATLAIDWGTADPADFIGSVSFSLADYIALRGPAITCIEFS